MNTKKISKIISVIMIIFMIATICLNVYAASTPDTFVNSISNVDKFDTFGGKLVGAIRAVGIIVSVAILIVLGVKYMMGSAEEKAEYKKSMIPYLIGALLVFTASTLTGIIYNTASDLVKS